VASGVVLVDQVTKILAVAMLEGEPSVPVLGEWLQLTFVRNPGAAFSLAGNYTVVISAIALVVSFFIVRTARTLTSTWWAVVLGGILGGAVGNLLDRIFRDPGAFRGYVVDFLELPNWPVFNVADMALVGSAVLAVILSLRGVEMGEPTGDAGGAVGDADGAAEDAGRAAGAADPEGEAATGTAPEGGTAEDGRATDG
jgi:signal peptidase II